MNEIKPTENINNTATENKDKIAVTKGKIKKAAITIALLAVSFLAGFFTCFSGMKNAAENIKDTDSTGIITDDTTVIKRQIETALESASQLITAKHTYQAVDIYENSKEFIGIKVPFTDNKVVYIYNGVVKAGIDLAAVEVEVVEKDIIINLPAVEIESSEVDENSFEYPYEDYSIFNKPDMADYVDLIAVLEENKRQEMLNNTEFITETRDNAKTVIEGFIRASKVTEGYNIVFK